MNSLFSSRVPGASRGASTTTVTYPCQGHQAQVVWESSGEWRRTMPGPSSFILAAQLAGTSAGPFAEGCEPLRLISID